MKIVSVLLRPRDSRFARSIGCQWEEKFLLTNALPNGFLIFFCYFPLAQLNLAVSIQFAIDPFYLDLLVGTMTAIASLVMLFVSIEAPTPVIVRLENSTFGEMLFTFRGRYIVDVAIALFLFAMGVWGIVMGVLTLVLIFGIRFLGVKRPDAFNEIFRQAEGDAADYTLDGTEEP